MAPRAVWKGYLRIGELSFPVALYTAVSTAERVSFHGFNRKTGNRLRRIFVDRDTGKEVARDDQVKGYEVAPDSYVVFEPEEIAATVPEGDKALAVNAFIACAEIDDLYFERPYYLAPAGPEAAEGYGLLRETLKRRNVAALASAVLFRRVRTVLIRAHEDGLTATLLNFDYEVRAAAEAFADIAPIRIDKEMLDLARHIIATKQGRFDPASFDDRYEAAVVELVQAKAAGRTVKPPKAKKPEKVVSLMEALRRSAGMEASEPAGKPAKSGKRAAPRASAARAKAGGAAPRKKAS
ncbi:DNA end-binding protein Ku [Ancylobacter sp. 3268]|uniref:non-homologous end joining protein Ku n=1 Tax=Ancylobacter sp. 3268 TaxID=2817752 RepID=UPI00285A5768|nr:Ku protein [Ancylobacter sp. 3268]MDR6951333.1 DNA end-binding protein Ku [Ancylobacter sp. 3268]